MIIEQQDVLLEEGNLDVEFVLVFSFFHYLQLIAAFQQLFVDPDDSHFQTALSSLLKNLFRFVISFCGDGDVV